MVFLKYACRNASTRSPPVLSILRSTIYQRASFATSRTCSAVSTKAVIQPPRPNLLSVLPPKRAPAVLPPSRPVKANTPLKNKSAYRAKALYESGVTNLYKGPSQFSYLASCYVFGTICVGGAVFMAITGYWDIPPEGGVPWFVPMAGKLSMMFLSGLGMYTLWMSTRHIVAIDLVAKAGQGKMCVSVRRYVPMPFLKPRKILIEPWELEMPTKLVRPLEIPTYFAPRGENRNFLLRALSAIPRRVSWMIWSIFAGTRKVFTQEGFLQVVIAERNGLFQNSMFKIDTTGSFANGGRSLIEVSTFNP